MPKPRDQRFGSQDEPEIAARRLYLAWRAALMQVVRQWPNDRHELTRRDDPTKWPPRPYDVFMAAHDYPPAVRLIERAMVGHGVPVEWWWRDPRGGKDHSPQGYTPHPNILDCVYGRR